DGVFGLFHALVDVALQGIQALCQQGLLFGLAALQLFQLGLQVAAQVIEARMLGLVGQGALGFQLLGQAAAFQHHAGLQGQDVEQEEGR
ncbi:hypothetical protein, partial [Salmonella enterica]|uniref:hypothetical protein n=1 Tax=Salmonella enterica TaxID=28901 RepID=UPI003CF96CFF